jgi:glycosyltransferase involved in cell wall biosynthesis
MLDNQTVYDYTVVLPCLNEELTIGSCIHEILESAKSENLSVEVIVSDNGSTDSSIVVAQNHGARIVNVPLRGYGAALNAGIREARSEVVIIGDSDMSYDFRFAPRMFRLINQNKADLVMGNRFKGGIEPGAMPNLHKYLGNPVLSLIGRIFFNIPIRDFHCGLRALRKSIYLTANPVTTGMEFATEMVARFANINARIVEVPVPLRKDGRNRKPHLRSFPDGWRHLKMMLL